MNNRKFIVGLLILLAGIVFSLPALKILGGGGSRFAIVPQPQTIRPLHGSFRLGPETGILVDPASRDTGEYLAERLRRSTGYPLPVRLVATAGATLGDILFTTNSPPPGLGTEGYELEVSSDSVTVRAPASAGLFYGVQSLLQLLPPEIFSSQPVPGRSWSIPCCDIQDAPRFAWRGFMLDVSRHFFTKAEVERVLDAMALHKLNVFHWHLTDDQGWRIEIKKYPRLNEIGAWRKGIGFGLDPKASTAYGPDGRYGGYYTQDDIREVVAYAQARHITIVPEIEMPGHSVAALAAYPEFSCSGGPYSTDPVMGSRAGIYCPGKEETFTFLENVLSEVCGLFPGKYIHIGGDEVVKENWRDCSRCQALIRREGLKNEQELQSYFIHRIAAFLQAHGRQAVGWSEIREGGLPAGAVLMDWSGGGIAAATNGHDVVMCPNEYCYFDYYQSRDREAEPPASGAYLPLEKVYAFDPIPAGLGPRYVPHILGPQANLWTEYIPSLKQAEYMMFPRLCAMAEVAWSPAAERNGEDFRRRLHRHLARLNELGMTYRKP
jgi:hexosaminidase